MKNQKEFDEMILKLSQKEIMEKYIALKIETSNLINSIKEKMQKANKMKTPHLDEKIKSLQEALDNGLVYPSTKLLYSKELNEYKAIKQQLENNPIVSTPDNPVWVVDENGNKRILLADFGREAIFMRYILIRSDYEESFLNNEDFSWSGTNSISPYTPKVSIEVTQEEAVKVEEFLKELRN